MTDGNECTIGSFDGIEECRIPETNMGHIQFYRNDTPTDCFLSVGEDNSMIFLKFTVIVAGESFRYWFHPKNDWLGLFCKTFSVCIVDPEMNILTRLTLNKTDVIKEISKYSQLKDYPEE